MRGRILSLVAMAMAAPALACSFIALLAPEGGSLAELDRDALPFHQYLRDHSRPPNNDGYGLAFYRGGMPDGLRTFYATGHNVWYGHGDNQVMDRALEAARDPAQAATLLLGHARNGTGGEGSHPFTFPWGGRTWTFMHNGDLGDGGPDSLKEGLLAGLERSGWFAALPPGRHSNWQGDPGDVTSWIDSELFFHYLMAHVIQADGDVVAGLDRALHEEDYFGCDVRQSLMAPDAGDPPSIVNFVLSDGRSLYVYKNSAQDGKHYRLSYHPFASGLVGVTNDLFAEGKPIDQYELLVLPPDGPPRHLDLGSPEAGHYTGAAPGLPPPPKDWATPPRKPTPRLEAELRPGEVELLRAWPNPFNPSTTIHFRLDRPARVRVVIHNLAGRDVAMLWDAPLGAGGHQLAWDGRDEHGRAVASGVYLCAVDDGQTRRCLRLWLLR